MLRLVRTAASNRHSLILLSLEIAIVPLRHRQTSYVLVIDVIGYTSFMPQIYPQVWLYSLTVRLHYEVLFGNTLRK